MNTKEQPFVTAVVPCYNSERYIKAALESLLAQTRLPDEIVVIDDASTDNSWEIIQALAAKHPRIKAQCNETNQGIPTTRNRLIQAMSNKAEYMAILDADDVATPKRIKTQLSFLENNQDHVLVGSDIGIINDEGVSIGTREYPHSYQDILKRALHFNPIAQSAVLMRTSVFDSVGVYDKRLARVQDYDLWLRILKAQYKVANLVQPLTLFRRHKEQGKETMAQKSVYYSWRVRARYIWRPQFFSFKGVALFIAYTLAMIFPKQMLNTIYSKLFVRKYDQNKKI